MRQTNRNLFECSGILAVVFIVLATTCVYSQAPLAATQPAGPVTQTNATLNGMAMTQGSPTIAWFEYGLSASYGLSTAPIDIGSGLKIVRVSAPISDLNPGAGYHFRLVASNAFGTVAGADTILVTGMKAAVWGTLVPWIPSGLTNVVGIASGLGHALALRTDGTVTAWKANLVAYGEYGQTNVPAGLTNVVAVDGGYSHSLALLADGTVRSWGAYSFGAPATFVPASLTNAVAIASGNEFSLALRNDGTVTMWGTSGEISIPIKLTNVVAITAGSGHCLALKADGRVVGWGSDIGGDPNPPSSLSNVIAISSETWHNLALRNDGTVVAWGSHLTGETNVPPGLSNVVAVSAGFLHSVALKADGTLVAWGEPAYVANVPADAADVLMIASGDYQSFLLSPHNLRPKSFANTVTGAINKDLVIQLSASDPNGDLLGFQITTPPTNGTLYQFTGAGRGSSITAPNTPTGSRVIFAPENDTFGAPYSSFVMSANDGLTDSPPALISVIILPPPSIQNASLVQGPAGGFQLEFTGLSNAGYGVLGSTDLVTWTRLGSATQATLGHFLFLYSSTTNWSRRFYRVTSP